MSVARIALVSARAAVDLDDDLPPLLSALQAAGAQIAVACWDDLAVDWAGFDLALLRSTWDYTYRLTEFLEWLDRVSRCTHLHNPAALVRWNIDKRYLLDLASAEVPVIASRFIAPGELVEVSDRAEFVLKPSVGAGSRGARRFGRGDRALALSHAAQLHADGYTVMVQPYLGRVDREGETALIHFNGQFSHAIRKGPLLRREGGDPDGLFAAEAITPRSARPAELDVAQQALRAIPGGMPLYARVDLIEDDEGTPRVLELELTEPSLFFASAPGSADLFAAEILRSVQR
jgi:O-ureido-D-serine cyclo-ligase